MERNWMASVMAGGAACLLAMGTAAWAQPETDGPGPRGGARLMERMDANEDGAVSLDEFLAAHKQRFTKMDADGSGVVSKEELAAARPKGLDRGRGERRGFKGMDANDDGTVSYEEAAAAHPGLTEEQFKARDTNGDGAWSPEDRDGRGGPQDEPPMAQKLDANGDGQITLEEFQAAGKERFSKMDTNSDGVLTQADRPEPPAEGPRGRHQGPPPAE